MALRYQATNGEHVLQIAQPGCCVIATLASPQTNLLTLTL